MARLPTLLALLLAPLASGVALAADDEAPAPSDDLEQRRELRAAWGWFGAGVGVTAGGLATMLVGRGNSGQISTEAPAVAEARSVIGAGMLITGLTTTLVGTVKLEQAFQGRGGRQTALRLTPLQTPGTTGLTFTLSR